MDRIELIQGDITSLPVDVVVTAANSELQGGGGVDGAVHRAAGPQLLAAIREIGSCPTGSAVITPGFNLSAGHVIHAVGPIYNNGQQGEPVLLAGAYRTSLQLAHEHQLASIAFPCISTGVYGYPLEPACEIAVRTVTEWLERHDRLRVVFCCFDAHNYSLYQKQLETR